MTFLQQKYTFEFICCIGCLIDKSCARDSLVPLTNMIFAQGLEDLKNGDVGRGGFSVGAVKGHFEVIWSGWVSW